MKLTNYYHLDSFDLIFIKLSTKLIHTFPFKWYYFMDIFFNQKITYIKDTTIILELNYLKEEDIKRVFTIVKLFLEHHIFRKIIYKKEFMIINVYDEFILSFFKEKTKWLTIPLYDIYQSLNYPIFYDAYLKEDETILNTMLCIIIKEKIITIDNKKCNKIFKNQIPLVINFYNNKYDNLMFSFDDEIYIKNLKEKLL